MTLYLAPTSSLNLIRYLRSANGTEGLEGAPSRRQSVKDAVNTVRALKELDVTAQYWLEHVGSPVHAFVMDRTQATRTKHLVTHVFSQPIPYGAFLDLGHDVCMCTPQYAFLRLAAQADIIELIHLGMELCGSYSLWRLESESEPQNTALSKDPESTGNCTFDLPPVMSTTRMEAYIERLRDQRGAVNARAALRWIGDGSASPMETATYMLLRLPKWLGGYGLPKPILNPRLKISNPDGIKIRYPDLFWPGTNIDVEYNSDADHSGEWSRYRDSLREVELTVADVRVLPLTRPQLMDVDAFDAFANGLRRMLGIRARKAGPDWEQRRDELRRILLSGYSS